MSHQTIATLETTLVCWLTKNNIGSEGLKRVDIARTLFWKVYDHNITSDDIARIQIAFAERPFYIREGNMWDQLTDYMRENGMDDSKFIDFWKSVADMTPPGLNTSPNACCGKFELLYRLVRPKSSQPNKGDVLDDGEKCEIKGNEARISHPRLLGTQYIAQTNKVFANSGFRGNYSNAGKTKREVFEIEKRKHYDHFAQQFATNPGKARELIAHYLTANQFTNEASRCIINEAGEFDQEELRRVTLRNFFANYKEEQGFD